MQIQDTLSAQRIDVTTLKGELPRVRSNAKPQDVLVSMKREANVGFAEAIAQLFEGLFLLMFFPFFIYTIFLASLSIMLFPLLIVLMPFIIAERIVREVLHTLCPCLFKDPNLYY